MKVCVLFFARTVLVLALLSVVAACPGTIDPGTSCGGSSGTSTLANWANLRDVVDNTCFGSDCHTQGDRQPYMLGLSAAPLADTDLYTKLTTYTTAKCGQRMLVKPCAPDESAFYLAQMGMCGDIPQMPFGCSPAYDNCTPADKLEGIRQWIANGAPRP